MSELGMDPQRVLALANKLEQAGTRTRLVGTTVDRLAAEMPALWRGGGGQRFVADWRTHRAALTSAADSIAELAGKARSNAADQIRTSNDYVGGVGGVPVGPTPYGPLSPGQPIPGPVGGGVGVTHPLFPPFINDPHGYDYTYQEPLGPVSATGSPEHVISVFEQNIHDVFPFEIEPPGPVHDGDIITLHPGPGFVGGEGVVRVNTTPTSVTFTVLNDKYFDVPGSQITFSTVEQNGQVYLQQHGATDSTNLPAFLGVHGGFTKITWDQQASNLRDQLGVPQPFDPSSPYDYYNWVQHHDGGDVHVPYVPTPIPLPIPDKFTPDINTPDINTPGFDLPVSPIPVPLPIPGGPSIPGLPSIHVPGVHIPSIHIPSLNPPNIDIHIG